MRFLSSGQNRRVAPESGGPGGLAGAIVTSTGANGNTAGNGAEDKPMPGLSEILHNNDSMPQHSDVVMDVVKYALLNTQKRGFLWRLRFKEKPQSAVLLPSVENAQVTLEAKRLLEQARSQATFELSRTHLNKLLFYAARYGDLKTLKDICKFGTVDVNVQDDEGRAPVMYAAIGNHDSIIAALKASSAIVNIPDRQGKTALHWACDYGNTDAARTLLYCGADLTCTDLSGKTPLHFAAAVQGTECLHAVLRWAKSDLVDATDDEGLTPLMVAASHGNEDCVQTLLNFGSRAEKKGPNEMIAFHYLHRNPNPKACSVMLRRHSALMSAKDKFGRTLLHLVAAEGNVTLLQYLLDVGANHLETDAQKRLPLHWAAANGHASCITALSGKGKALDNPDQQGASALHYAAQNNHLNCAIILIKKGANMDALDSSGRSPIMWAAHAGTNEIIKMLLNHEVSLEVQDKSGSNLLHILASKGNIEIIPVLIRKGLSVDTVDLANRTALMHAIVCNQIDICNVLLLEGSNIDHSDADGYTPLLLSIALKHFDITKLLIQKGASLSIADKNGNQAIHEIIRCGESSIFVMLLMNKVNINAQNKQLQTPVHIAASFGQFECLRSLILAGANLNPIDCQGKTPLDLANENHQLACASILKACGGLTLAKLQEMSAVLIKKFFSDLQIKRRRSRLEAKSMSLPNIKAALVVRSSQTLNKATAQQPQPQNSLNQKQSVNKQKIKNNAVTNTAASVIQQAWRTSRKLKYPSPNLAISQCAPKESIAVIDLEGSQELRDASPQQEDPQSSAAKDVDDVLLLSQSPSMLLPRIISQESIVRMDSHDSLCAQLASNEDDGTGTNHSSSQGSNSNSQAHYSRSL